MIWFEMRSALSLTIVLLFLMSESSRAETGIFIDPIVDGSAITNSPALNSNMESSFHEVIKFSSLPLIYGVAQVQLSGGSELIDLKDWSSIAASNQSSGTLCTLSLIGPRVVLLAAHCVDPKLTGSSKSTVLAANVRFVIPGQPYKMDCTMSPDYLSSDLNEYRAPRNSFDYALCELDRPVPDIDFETISLTRVLGVGSNVTLLGKGCIRLGISETTNKITSEVGEGILRIGQQTIEATNVSYIPGGPSIYWRILSSTGQEPSLCYGDSGGPVMVIKSTGGREIVGVNSALGRTDNATHSNPSFYSYLSPLRTPEFSTFLKKWTSESSSGVRRICGFSIVPGNEGCRY